MKYWWTLWWPCRSSRIGWLRRQQTAYLSTLVLTTHRTSHSLASLLKKRKLISKEMIAADKTILCPLLIAASTWPHQSQAWRKITRKLQILCRLNLLPSGTTHLVWMTLSSFSTSKFYNVLRWLLINIAKIEVACLFLYNLNSSEFKVHHAIDNWIYQVSASWKIFRR